MQFLAGVALQRQPSEADSLLISYGVNDCTARVASIQLDRVLAMLEF